MIDWRGCKGSHLRRLPFRVWGRKSADRLLPNRLAAAFDQPPRKSCFRLMGPLFGILPVVCHSGRTTKDWEP